MNLSHSAVRRDFDEFGFDIVSDGVGLQVTSKISRTLPDPHNWQKRLHRLGAFDRNTTVGEAGEMARFTTPRPPEPLFAADSPGEAATLATLAASEGSQRWKVDFLDTANRDWIRTFGRVVEVPLADFMTSVLSDGSGPVPDDIRTNLAALLSLRETAGGPVSFPDYLALMLGFGPLAKLRQSIEGLTTTGPSARSFARFQPWFWPGLSEEDALTELKQAGVATWLVRRSPLHNRFVLHWYAGKLWPPAVVPLRYDGLAVDSKVCRAWQGRDEPDFGPSWRELLTQTCGMVESVALGSRPQQQLSPGDFGEGEPQTGSGEDGFEESGEREAAAEREQGTNGAEQGD
jgi:hypothetical protein